MTKDSPWWTLTPDDLARQGIEEPFWAFAWSGGQALARYLLDHPHIVKNQCVIDFGAGGGIVSLAALCGGAQSIVATEIDPWALVAYKMNLRETDKARMVLENWIGRELSPGTLLLCGDMSYSRELCDELMQWFDRLKGVRIIIGDAGRGFIDRSRFLERASYEAPADYDSDGRYFIRASVLEYIHRAD